MPESDRAALVAAVCAAPDDDLPRLIFADWLDEQGDPTRAEFVRVQCEMEGVEPFGPRWRALDVRQRGLLDPFRAEWASDLAGRIVNVEFRRGFPDEVTLYSKRFAAEWDELFALAPIRRVKFVSLDSDRGTVPLPDLLACPGLARLLGLDLTSTLLRAEAISLIAGCPRLAGLREFRLAATGLRAAELRPVIHTPNLPALTDLTIGGGVGNDFLPILAADRGFRRIARLTLQGTGTGPRGIQGLAGSPHAAGLRWLAVTGDGGGPALSRCGPEAVKTLAASPHLAGLVGLDLGGQGIGAGGVKAIAASPHLTALRHLDLSYTPLSKAMVAALLDSEVLRAGLVSLGLRGCGLDAGGLTALRQAFGGAAVFVGE